MQPIRPLQSYLDAGVDLRLGTRVTAIDFESKTVTMSTSEAIVYAKLMLATGARVRPLPVPGATGPNVFYLRDEADSAYIRAAIKEARRAVVVGSGYIGLEAAASLRKLGVAVTVLEAMPRILQRVTASEVSRFYARIHREQGVRIVENAVVDAIEPADAGGVRVTTTDGQAFAADIVIIGIGVLPNDELAAEAGLGCANGIEVNAYYQTPDTDIYAIGDVAWHHKPYYDGHLRLESVPNATDQAKIAAGHICGGSEVYGSVPWFWSDQYDLKLRIAGLSNGYDDLVLRGDPNEGRSFAAFYFKGNRLLAVDAINAPREFAFTRMELGKSRTLDKRATADPTIPLTQTLAKEPIC